MSSGGRRGFFASLISGARSLVAELEADDGPRFTPPPATHRPTAPQAKTRPLVRPPGALAEAEFIAACTQCGACIAACPEKTLAVGPGGFPVAEPWRSACALCPTTPCIAACDSNALVPTRPELFRLGTARVNTTLCINTADPDAECDRCLDWCPVPGAITADESLVPTIDPARCTGCGLCILGCAAYPKAIALR